MVMLAKRFLRRHWKPLFLAPARIAAWFVAACAAQLVLWVDASGWALVACIATYGIFAITEAIKHKQPQINVQTVKPDVLFLDDGQHGVSMEAVKEMIDRSIDQAMEKHK